MFGLRGSPFIYDDIAIIGTVEMNEEVGQSEFLDNYKEVDKWIIRVINLVIFG